MVWQPNILNNCYELSGGYAPQTTHKGLCPWTPLGTSVPQTPCAPTSKSWLSHWFARVTGKHVCLCDLILRMRQRGQVCQGALMIFDCDNIESILFKRRTKFMRKFTEDVFGDVFG